MAKALEYEFTICPASVNTGLVPGSQEDKIVIGKYEKEVEELIELQRALAMHVANINNNEMEDIQQN